MKTLVIFHKIDLDGWMSAAVVKHWQENQPQWLIEKYLEDGTYPFDFVGYNYDDPIPDMSKYKRIFLVDVVLPDEKMEELRDLHEKGELFTFWIDHHASAIAKFDKFGFNGYRYVNYAACELTWRFLYFEKEMPEIVRLLGMYDSFRHKGTHEEKLVLEFQYGARCFISNYNEAYQYLTSSIKDYKVNIVIKTAGQDIYKYLCTEARQAYKNKFDVFIPYAKPHRSVGVSKGVHKFCAINKERFNPVNFGIDYHSEGYEGAVCFHFDGMKWTFSLYNDNGKIDVSKIAQNYGGGGHKGAAGFKVEKIEKFLWHNWPVNLK